jgi:hypothetical protein
MAGAESSGGKIVVNELKGFRKLLPYLFLLFYKAYFGTLRFRFADGVDVPRIACAPAVFLIWHNRFLISPQIRARFLGRLKVHAMVSASRDGAWSAGILRTLGFVPARGSSSKRGGFAALELIEAVRSGGCIAMTPDGPRGPMYTFHEGSATIALACGAPVMLVFPVVKRGWRLNNWDGTYLPTPFSSVVIKARRIEASELPQERSECARFLRSAMMEMTSDLLPDPPKVRHCPPDQECA